MATTSPPETDMQPTTGTVTQKKVPVNPRLLTFLRTLRRLEAFVASFRPFHAELCAARIRTGPYSEVYCPKLFAQEFSTRLCRRFTLYQQMPEGKLKQRRIKEIVLYHKKVWRPIIDSSCPDSSCRCHGQDWNVPESVGAERTAKRP